MGVNDDMIRDLIRSVGPDSAHNLIAFFLEETHDRLHHMEDMAATDQLVELTREAHSLKSAAFTYGAETLGEMARTLEMACRAGDMDAIGDAHQALMDNAGAELKNLEEHSTALMKES